MNSDAEIGWKSSQGDVLRKHITTVLTEFVVAPRKESFTTLYYNVNVDKELAGSEGSGDESGVVSTYSSSKGN